MSSKFIHSLLLIGVFMGHTSCGQVEKESDSIAIEHTIWDKLLKRNIDESGMVSYEGFINDSIEFNTYLSLLSSSYPNDINWSREQKLAYWINTYNAFTVKLIIDNYPVNSIKDLNPKISVPYVNTIWDEKFFSIEGIDFSLNMIEHDILRKEFSEPRIHFAINCASFSCPDIRKEAFTAEKVENQLEEQAIEFINNPSKNIISKDKVELSKIFNWYKGDFIKKSSLIEFLNLYSKIEIHSDAEIGFLDYDWSLNSSDGN